MLKLGEKIISDIYLGDKKIAKVFLGDKLMYQANKPIFLDYVESTGTQLINLGITGNGEVEITAQATALRGSNTVLLGTTGGRAGTYIGYNASGYWGAGSDSTTSIKATQRATITATFDDSGVSGYVDGEMFTRAKVVEHEAWSLFKDNTGGSPFTGCVFCVTAKQNGKKVLDLRPCIDPKGTVCMYDMVTKKYFYNKGTGTLTAGNKINFVDYIIFDGNSYIDTNVVPVFGDELEVYASIGDTVSGVNYSLFGAGTSSSQFLSLFETKSLLNRYFGSTTGRGSFGKKETLSKLKFKNNGSVYIDDVQVIAPFSVSNNTVNTVLSIGARGGGTQPWLGKIGVLKLISSTGAVKLDLKPCVVAGEAGFYDMVTGKFYTNIGTGTLGYTE